MEPVDYSHEVRVIRYPILRYFLIFLSWLLVLLGFVGVFVPILPTTPFLLLAAYLYSKSSPRFYNWLMNHRLFGPPLRRWKEHGAVSRKAKILAISCIVLTFTPTILFVVPLLSVKIGLGILGVSVAMFLATRPEGNLSNDQKPLKKKRKSTDMLAL